MGSTSGSTQGSIGSKTRRVTIRDLFMAVLGSAKRTFGAAGTKLFGVSDPPNA